MWTALKNWWYGSWEPGTAGSQMDRLADATARGSDVPLMLAQWNEFSRLAWQTDITIHACGGRRWFTYRGVNFVYLEPV